MARPGSRGGIRRGRELTARAPNGSRYTLRKLARAHAVLERAAASRALETLNGGKDHIDVVVAAANRRGKAISCKVTSLLHGANKEVRGAILMMEEQLAAVTH